MTCRVLSCDRKYQSDITNCWTYLEAFVTIHTNLNVVMSCYLLLSLMMCVAMATHWSCDLYVCRQSSRTRVWRSRWRKKCLLMFLKSAQLISGDLSPPLPPLKVCACDHCTCACDYHVTWDMSILICSGHLKLVPQSFEKDDDSNGHIDFITAASVSHMIIWRMCVCMCVCTVKLKFFVVNIIFLLARNDGYENAW